jgi:phage major head subunit gpT-like protein
MIINEGNLAALFLGFNVSFNKGLGSAPSYYQKVATVTQSGAETETYAWLGEFPRLRKWIGDRIIKNLMAHTYAIKNETFETSVGVKRSSIEDDRYGVYGPLMEEMGRVSAEHPDELIFTLLGSGFTVTGYDKKPFFATDHPTQNPDGTEGAASNFADGSGPAWFLLDTSRPMRPLIFQKRIDYELQSLVTSDSEHVFKRDEYLYGVRARVNAGFGLWQLAYASKLPLTPDNYAAARQAMQELKGEEGRPLGIVPNTLVYPPALEKDALRVVKNGLTVVDGAAVTNEWAGTADPIGASWLT